MAQLVAAEAMICNTLDLGSEDCNEICFCGDAGGFVIKKSDKIPTVPHTEWFCSTIAEIAGVPQVPFNIVHHTDGNYWFGSEWKKGRIKDWWLLAEQGTIDLSSLNDDLSRIYALDLFIHNDDRHLNNYMVVPSGAGHNVYSFDYSRAWLCHGFPPPDNLSAASSTMAVKEHLKARLNYTINPVVMFEVLNQINGINSGRVKDIIEASPAEWLTDAQKNAIVDWWIDGLCSVRINNIKAGIENGELL